MARKYKVIALSVGGNGNRIFKHGETVSEENFGKDRTEELVKGGFLKPMKAEKAADLIEQIEAAETVEQVNEIWGNDKRATVVDAAEKKIAELEEAAKEGGEGGEDDE